MEASKPLEHPTLADMELPQLEQALALAELANERCKLSSFLPSDGGDGARTSPPGGGMTTIGLLPLALAWEGSALALLAARGVCAIHQAKFNALNSKSLFGILTTSSTLVLPLSGSFRDWRTTGYATELALVLQLYPHILDIFSFFFLLLLSDL